MIGWGVLNDRFGKTRLFVMVATAGTTCSALAISVLPGWPWVILGSSSFSIFSSALIPLLDSTTLSLLGEHKEAYGRQRIWGSFGYIVTSAGAGILLQQTGMRAMFPAYAVVMAGFFIAASGLPNRPIHLGGFSLRGLGQMVRQPSWLVFSGSIILLGLGFAGVSNFVSVMIKTLGGSESLIGLSWTMAAISELPILYFSAELLRRWGPARVVATGLATYGIRFALYAIMPSPAWALGIHALCGSGFGLFWVGAVAYVSEIAPPHLKTTSQGLLMSLMSIASVGSSLITGWLFDQAGPRGLSLALAASCFLSLVLFSVGQTAIRRRAALRSADNSAPTL
jgi:PPP family 3-phenylpropionic acid transporter